MSTISRTILVEYCSDLLQAKTFTDYCPNGLQVEGRDTIHTIVSGVTASLALLEAAKQHHADLILVHHGYFWRGQSPVITGMMRQRLSLLLAAEINLLAYHLPLDAHEEFGNNIRLARLLNIECLGPVSSGSLVFHGRLQEPCSATAFTHLLQDKLARKPVHIAGKAGPISSLAWCTGAAQDSIDIAADLGVDAFISGEISERTVHTARETGVHYFACGHHATERYGVQALGDHLAERFGVKHYFVDIDNPV
jgi:dinuclear metal center YbgI/SA1388 family protein